MRVPDDIEYTAGSLDGTRRPYAHGLVRYDSVRRRVWVGEQRLHHGLTGALLTGLGMAGLAAHRLTARGGVEWALFGSVLMAHDWHDRSLWFQRGAQEDRTDQSHGAAPEGRRRRPGAIEARQP